MVPIADLGIATEAPTKGSPLESLIVPVTMISAFCTTASDLSSFPMTAFICGVPTNRRQMLR